MITNTCMDSARHKQYVNTISIACRSLAIALITLLTAVYSGNAISAKAAQDKKEITVLYLMLDQDEHYAVRRAYTGLKLNEPKRPLDGVKLGVKEAKIPGRSLGLTFKLVQHSLSAPEGAKFIAELDLLIEQTNSWIIITDLPLEQTKILSRHLANQPVLVFNPRLKQDELRAGLCSANLFHTIPSFSMLSDALAQFLKSRNWTTLLALQGPTRDDASWVKAMEKSAIKFGLKIAGKHDFILSNNPRDRDKTNIPAMTAKPRHDVVFIADSIGEFARYVPYQTYSPSLVVGTEGLSPAAWHWTWERHGAPQLNQRFDRLAKRQLDATEWAGWAAAKSFVTAIVKAKSTEFSDVFEQLRSDQLTLDLYKGAPGSFRNWNNQLRQPLLLHTHNAVIERAPLDGFMHQYNTLDTLGVDESESSCG